MKLLVSLLVIFTATTVCAGKKIKNLPRTISGVDSLIEISGISTGYDKSINRRKDGHIDFALILPSLTTDSLLNFDLNNILSPKSDSIIIINQKFEIPSNFSLPTQKESYVRSIEIDKPIFRTYVAKDGSYPLNAIHGKFKVKSVVDKIASGKPIFDILNDFQFLGGEQIQVNTTKKSKDHSIGINQFSFKGKATITAPSYDSSELTLLSLPLESINGKYLPTDLKYIGSGESMNVTTSESSNPIFSLNILADQVQQFEDPEYKGNDDDDEDEKDYLYFAEFSRITMSLLPLKDKLTPTFLDFIDAPSLSSSDSKLNFTPPPLAKGTAALATIVELVETTKFRNGKLISEFKKSMWKSVKSGWINSVSLPDIELTGKKGVTYRYEVSFVATSDLNVDLSAEKVDLDKFSLLTKNYLVIQ